jgi:DNA-binding transcriptional LysR family regulator
VWPVVELMDLRELRYFLAVFEERSVSAAARRCFVSQPSVSESIASLESELSTRLFVRHRKGATPTAAAEQLYPRARELVEAARALPALFRAGAEDAGPRPLTLGLMRSLDVARTRDLLACIVKDGALDLRLVDAEEPCDVRIISRSLRAPEEVFVLLWEERYVVALPPGHALAQRKTLRASDLAGARLVMRCHCENASRLVGESRRVQVVAAAPSEEWAVALVAAGVGIAVVPEGVVSKSDGVVVRALDDERAKREVGLAYDAKAPPSPQVQRIVDAFSTRRGTRRTVERPPPRG